MRGSVPDGLRCSGSAADGMTAPFGWGRAAENLAAAPCIRSKTSLLYDQSSHHASRYGSGQEDARGGGARRQDKDVATSPTALRILDAAKKILSERGYSKLTLQAIEEESGEYRALVAYYFGSKQGLVDAIIDSLMDNEDRALRERLEGIEKPEARVRTLIDEQRQISADWRGFCAFYELLPHIMRDDRLREDLAANYTKSRELDRQTLAAGSAVGGVRWPRRRRQRPRQPRGAQRRHRRGPGRAVRRRPGAVRPRGRLPPLGGHGAHVPQGEATGLTFLVAARTTTSGGAVRAKPDPVAVARSSRSGVADRCGTSPCARDAGRCRRRERAYGGRVTTRSEPTAAARPAVQMRTRRHRRAPGGPA